MDIDEIVTDLLEKRKSDFLSEAVDSLSKYQGPLHRYVEKTMAEILEKRRSEIKEVLIKVVEDSLLKGIPKLSFNYNIEMNIPHYKIAALYEKSKKEHEK